VRIERRSLGRVVAFSVASLLFGGCTLHYQDLSTGRSETFSLVGQRTSTESVTAIPANVHFSCAGTGGTAILYRVPGDPRAGRAGFSSDPMATTGIERDGWSPVVTRLGVIGWIETYMLSPFGALYPGSVCSVHQDSQGRIVFAFHLKGYHPHMSSTGL